MAGSVLFLRPKQRRTRPSHSTKLTCGFGCRGSIRTTLESTFGGGRKELRETFIRWSTRASSCVLTERRQYSSSPGLAQRRIANSRCTISTAHRNGGPESSLKTSGDEIWYGMFATITSKKGCSALTKSPWMICSLGASGVPCTRFCSSTTIRGSSSTATTRFATSSSLSVKLPVPGPTSHTTSVERTAAFSTIATVTSGFLSKCCPKS
mmetsp:Transcript_14383/g.44895  ORF Transcript_14383/g.44895 Transcript_14383/m.44895 type:complete len:209 (-) Transcript_14383:105-731(-)